MNSIKYKLKWFFNKASIILSIIWLSIKIGAVSIIAVLSALFIVLMADDRVQAWNAFKADFKKAFGKKDKEDKAQGDANE